MHTETVNRDDQDIKGKQRAYLDTIRRGLPYVIEVPVFDRESVFDYQCNLEPVAVPELTVIARKTLERVEPQSAEVSLVLPTPRGNFRSSKTHEGLEIPRPPRDVPLWHVVPQPVRLSVKGGNAEESIAQTFFGVADERLYLRRVELSWQHPVYHPFLEEPKSDSVALAGVLVAFPVTRVCVAFSAVDAAHDYKLAQLWRKEQTPESLARSVETLAGLYRQLTSRTPYHHETQAVYMRSDMLALYKRCLLVIELQLGRDIANATLRGLSKGLRKYLNGIAARISQKSPSDMRELYYSC